MTDTTGRRWSGWAVFAGVLLLIAGILDLVFGLVAVIGPNDAYLLSDAGTLFRIDVAGWGWWHIISGTLLVLTAFAVFAGATWARVVAIILVGLNALGQLSLLSVQPWLSLAILAVDILVIYALTVHGPEFEDAD
ncbi:DUF7144 family membrane protein [Microbacterium terricola]|uniref:Membrane protein n=1 Tax=Microbacterium terricola TaxID=344163 RepID=A0ABM8DVI6_9MICO|nr:hypothetical protein [Microbacterium terricola]UYK39634.1 hypothetical protein OAU46_13155 [Microbacterium terricola]BDV29625.1 membrane protein [Microbacterium terricola]